MRERIFLKQNAKKSFFQEQEDKNHVINASHVMKVVGETASKYFVPSHPGCPFGTLYLLLIAQSLRRQATPSSRVATRVAKTLETLKRNRNRPNYIKPNHTALNTLAIIVAATSSALLRRSLPLSTSGKVYF